MHELGLRPDKGHVKSSRVVGEVMGKYHPHGDSAIYDALVRMAQPFTMRLPLVDGHGNFGSLDDGPAASRYTEARMAPAALLMVTGLDEDTVDFVPNYDDTADAARSPARGIPQPAGQRRQSGSRSGWPRTCRRTTSSRSSAPPATSSRTRRSLDDLMKFVPGPDLPGGGRIVGLDGIRDAYLTGPRARSAPGPPRRSRSSPRGGGHRRHRTALPRRPREGHRADQDLVQGKKLQGISDVKDLTDRKHGLRLVIEVKNGFNPEAVLEQLYKLTPMEDSFGINNVALVDGQPRTLGLKELLRCFVDFRIEVVRRRTEFRLAKRKERLHLVEGLLIAILDIDEVIQLIRVQR
jgi:DNA gyrase subunit A